ncbi:unnamed protein product [Soboliphyme baturini]|uniref:Arrestin_C domain-containing protein n=1 Tax=Soboliphyme baturini TaxID=241478 RepID=A0A183JAL4_9BILA|nr:unnamed protein product [Soboliphyme baturini]
MIIDVPYANPPRCLKYFSLIGPNIDCMEEKYMTAMVGQDEKTTCCFCCRRGPIALRLTLERSAYVCGENIRVVVEVENHIDQDACVKLKLEQVK